MTLKRKKVISNGKTKDIKPKYFRLGIYFMPEIGELLSEKAAEIGLKPSALAKMFIMQGLNQKGQSND